MKLKFIKDGSIFKVAIDGSEYYDISIKSRGEWELVPVGAGISVSGFFIPPKMIDPITEIKKLCTETRERLISKDETIKLLKSIISEALTTNKGESNES